MKRVQERFNEEFGEGSTVCLKCDVTSQADFESNGILIFLSFII